MTKSLLGKSALVVGAAASFLALGWLLSVDRGPLQVFANAPLVYDYRPLVADPHVVASMDFSSRCDAILHTCDLGIFL
jgi:hypothetical protein